MESNEVKLSLRVDEIDACVCVSGNSLRGVCGCVWEEIKSK